MREVVLVCEGQTEEVFARETLGPVLAMGHRLVRPRLVRTSRQLAFYDALGVNDSAVQVLGDKTLCGIARELVATVRGNVTIDWTLRENVRAHLRRLVKRILRKHGYPLDKQESATRTVLSRPRSSPPAGPRDGRGG